MKGDGYPEDSTQSAYSSQLIWIPLSHHFFFFLFYLWGFISREATKRQYRGGDQNQRLGEMPADVRKYVSLPHFRLEKSSASDRTSRAALVFPSTQTFRALSRFALSQFCLGRRRSDWKSPLSPRARRTSRLKPSPRKASFLLLKRGSAVPRWRPWSDRTMQKRFFRKTSLNELKEYLKPSFLVLWPDKQMRFR